MNRSFFLPRILWGQPKEALQFSYRSLGTLSLTALALFCLIQAHRILHQQAAVVLSSSHSSYPSASMEERKCAHSFILTAAIPAPLSTLRHQQQTRQDLPRVQSKSKSTIPSLTANGIEPTHNHYHLHMTDPEKQCTPINPQSGHCSPQTQPIQLLPEKRAETAATATSARNMRAEPIREAYATLHKDHHLAPAGRQIALAAEGH